MGDSSEQYQNRPTRANPQRDGPKGLIADRHRGENRTVTLLVGAAILGILIGLWQGRAGLRQAVLLGLVTLLVLEYTTGRLGVLWNDGLRDSGHETDENTGGETEVGILDARGMIAVGVIIGLLGFVLHPQTTRNLINVAVASVAIHVVFLYGVNRNGKEEPQEWSCLIVDRVRIEGGKTIVRLKNVCEAESVDLRNAEIEDGFGNRHLLRGSIVLAENQTEVFAFDVNEAFRPEQGQPLRLYTDGTAQTILWEKPED